MILQVKDLVIGFGDKPIVHVSDFKLKHGDKILITGESGCGKSQFLHTLLGLIEPQHVWSGSFYIDSKPLALCYSQYRRQPMIARRFSAVFQDAQHSLHPHRSIRAQCPSDEKLYKQFNLDSHYFLDYPRHAAECSGGECQRLSLLFPAYQQERDVILLDEPLTDIDKIAHKGLQSLIQNYFLNEPAKTVILVTHKPAWALASMQHYSITGDARPKVLGIAKSLPPPAPVSHHNHTTTGSVFFKVELTKAFQFDSNPHFCIWPFSIALKEKQSFGLIGESGSGKTTLIRIAVGCLAQRLYRSHFQVQLLCDGKMRTLTSLPPRQRYSLVQMVFQNSTGTVNRRECIGGRLRWIRWLVGAPAAAFEQRLSDWGGHLQLFSNEVEKRAFRSLRCGELSMGMLRRFGLLCAFLRLDTYQEKSNQQPKLLFLDEVARGLDEVNLNCLVDALQAFRVQYNVAVMAISHDLDFIDRVTDSSKIMFKGGLLPRFVTPESLQKPASIQSSNPYYQDFLNGVEGDTIPPENREKQTISRYGGCLYARYMRCKNAKTPQCRHIQFTENGEIGVCE